MIEKRRSGFHTVTGCSCEVYQGLTDMSATVMQADCEGNATGSEADDDDELESGISEETVLKIDEGAAEDKLVRGRTGSSIMQDKCAIARKSLTSLTRMLRRVRKGADTWCWS